MQATQFNLIDSADSTMEVLEVRSDVPETALRAGERIARKFRAMGHACSIVGLVMVEEDMAIETPINRIKTDPCGMYGSEYRTTYVKRTFYRPVLSPPTVSGE